VWSNKGTGKTSNERTQNKSITGIDLCFAVPVGFRAGGKPGSIWVVNSLNLLVGCQGLTFNDTESSYDLRAGRFFFTPEDLAAARKLQPVAGDGV